MDRSEALEIAYAIYLAGVGADSADGSLATRAAAAAKIAASKRALARIADGEDYQASLADMYAACNPVD